MAYRVGIYLRISDDREGRELGVTRQEEDTRALCERVGDLVVDVYKDNDIGASTRSKKPRPEYQRLLSDARSGRINKIVAYTSSRLTRRPREHEDQIDLAESRGLVFAYVASPSFDLNTSAGRRIARMLAANDAGESEDISERIVRAKLQNAQSGRPHGGRRPYGYESDGMTLIPEEAEVIRDSARRVLEGESLRSICMALDAAGVPTTRDTGRWDSLSLRAILLRPRNIAQVVYRGEVIGPAQWPPIFAAESEEIWHAACALLRDESRNTVQDRSHRYLGTGLYLCGYCDDGTTVRITGNKGQTAYRCRTQGHLVRVAAPIDDYIERVVVERLGRPDAVRFLRPQSPVVDLVDLRTQAEAARVRLRGLDDELDDGEISKSDWTRRTGRLRSRLSALSDQLAAASPTTALSGLVGNPDAGLIWYGSLPDRSDRLPISRRAAVARALMTVTLMPLGRVGRLPPGAPPLRPGSVRIDWLQ